jgi:hypothetical protein
MQSLRYLIAVAALAFTMPAQAAVGDPEVILYRTAGVVDADSGWATTFLCTNFSGVNGTLTVVTRGATSTITVNHTVIIPHLNTVALSTREVFLFADTNMNTGVVNPGTAAIAATSVNITCSAVQVQSNNAAPLMVKLHMTRFNPIPGTQE